MVSDHHRFNINNLFKVNDLVHALNDIRHHLMSHSKAEPVLYSGAGFSNNLKYEYKSDGKNVDESMKCQLEGHNKKLGRSSSGFINLSFWT